VIEGPPTIRRLSRTLGRDLRVLIAVMKEDFWVAVVVGRNLNRTLRLSDWWQKVVRGRLTDVYDCHSEELNRRQQAIAIQKLFDLIRRSFNFIKLLFD
jgi:hypothetical protein